MTTAAQLARELEVSERTIYRDIGDLSRSGVPVTGEAGVGYALLPGFDLPPLMFTRPELEAIILGVRAVKAWGDADLATSAGSALERIEATLPGALRTAAADTALYAPGFHVPPAVTRWIAPIRAAMGAKRKAVLHYERPSGERSQRTVQPLGLFFWGDRWSLLVWCELRGEFRNFRLDRIRHFDELEETYEDVPGRTLEDFLERVQKEPRVRAGQGKHPRRPATPSPIDGRTAT